MRMSDIVTNWGRTPHNPVIRARIDNGIIVPGSFRLESALYDGNDDQIDITFDSFCLWWQCAADDDPYVRKDVWKSYVDCEQFRYDYVRETGEESINDTCRV